MMTDIQRRNRGRVIHTTCRRVIFYYQLENSSHTTNEIENESYPEAFNKKCHTTCMKAGLMPTT